MEREKLALWSMDEETVYDGDKAVRRTVRKSYKAQEPGKLEEAYRVLDELVIKLLIGAGFVTVVVQVINLMR